jgi:hypothetical protein
VNTFNDRKSCDFDGDGIGDPFIATGATFWYSSSVLGGRWVFLGQSPARLDEVTFGDFDGDGRCDVSARGQEFLNPDPLPFARSPGGVSTVIGKPALLNLVATGGARPYSWTVTGLPLGLSANSAGQITGTPVPGAAANNLVTATVTDANHDRRRRLLLVGDGHCARAVGRATDRGRGSRDQCRPDARPGVVQQQLCGSRDGDHAIPRRRPHGRNRLAGRCHGVQV